MFTTLIVSALLNTPLAQAQSQTPPKGNPPPIIAPPPADGKAPHMVAPPAPTNTAVKGNECKTEAKTAGCKDASVGPALLQCMMGYKKAHKEFSVSPDCRVAIQKWHMGNKAK